MKRSFGLPPARLVRAADQLSKSQPATGIQPLPSGTGGRGTPESLGLAIPSGPINFYVIGDSGGINDPNPQQAVASAMSKALRADLPGFIYHVGDIVYFNGDANQYGPQFYEPYGHLNVPILGIPGNHDGDTTDDASRAPLDTFMANFCTASPEIPPGDPQFEYGRHTQTQPYCYWTLALPQVTIIGLYSNVPSGGYLDSTQVAWLTAELKAAGPQPLIVALHHPPYSVDAHHGGSAAMSAALDSAFQASRYPDLVLSGHVHDFQVFSRAPATRYIVIGNSGYHNLHALAGDANPGLNLGNGVTFDYGDDQNWGFLKLTADGTSLKGNYTGARLDGTLAASYSF